MEMFVFLRTGGQRESMVVRILAEGDDLYHRLERFDAGKARCRLDDDRQKLLAIIEAGFGTFAPFNALVQRIFADASEENSDSFVSATTESSSFSWNKSANGAPAAMRTRRRSSHTLRGLYDSAASPLPAKMRRPSFLFPEGSAPAKPVVV